MILIVFVTTLAVLIITGTIHCQMKDPPPRDGAIIATGISFVWLLSLVFSWILGAFK